MKSSIKLQYSRPLVRNWVFRGKGAAPKLWRLDTGYILSGVVHDCRTIFFCTVTSGSPKGFNQTMLPLTDLEWVLRMDLSSAALVQHQMNHTRYLQSIAKRLKAL